MEDMDGKDAVTRSRVFVCYDLLVEYCQGKWNSACDHVSNYNYVIVIECVESNRSRNYDMNGFGEIWN